MRIFLTIFCTVISFFAFGGNGIDTVLIGEVQVQSKRESAMSLLPVQKLDSSLVALYSGQNLQLLLEKASPLSFKNYGSSGSSMLSFRGANASHTKVLWNGVPLSSPMLGMLDFSVIPVSATDEVKIEYGAGVALYGNGAMAGTIILNNRPDRSLKRFIELQQEYGSFGSNSTLLHTRFAQGRWFNETSFNYHTSRNDYPFINYTEFGKPEQRQKNAFVEQYGLSHHTFYTLSPGAELALHLWFQGSDRNIGPPMFNLSNASFQQDESLRTVLSFRKKWNANISYTSNLSWINEYLRYVNRLRSQSVEFVLLDSKSRFNQLLFTNSVDILPGIKTSIRTGIDISLEHASIKEYGTDRQRERASVYLIADHQLVERLRLLASARAEIFQDKQEYASLAGFDLLLVPKINMRLKANVSSNYNIPSLNDLYWVPGGNPDLNAERGIEKNIVLMSRFGTGELKFDMAGTYYHSIIRDWILWQPSAIENGIWTPQNLRRVRRQGVEFNSALTYERRSFKAKLNVFFTVGEAINLEPVSSTDLSVGKQLIYVPKYKTGSQLMLNYHGFYANYSYSHIGYRYTTSDNTLFLPAYLLHDMMIGKVFNYKSHAINVSAGLSNIADTYYESLPYRPMQGRALQIRLNYQLKQINK